MSLLSRMAVRSPGKRPNNPLLRRQASERGSKYEAGEGDEKRRLIKGGSILLFELCLSRCRVFIHETHFLGLGMSRSNQKLGVTLALIKMLGSEVISVNRSQAFPASSHVTRATQPLCILCLGLGLSLTWCMTPVPGHFSYFWLHSFSASEIQISSQKDCQPML